MIGPPLSLFRSCLIALVAAAMAAGQPGGPALPAWNVLYGVKEFAQANSMFSSYLSRLRAEEDARSSKRIAGLSSPEAVRRYQSETRARLLAALGDPPPRTPLNARITGTLERDGYAVEKLIFESRPRYYVTANVYVPRKRSGPFPAVLAPVGHWGAGKSFEEYQRLGIFLARRGYLTLVYDVPGQGERRQYYDPVLGRALIDPGGSHWFVTLEHGYAGAQAILTGGNYASYLVWDGIRAIDYLSERPDVDRNRIACTGTSGGGLQTELLSAADERIKVSIPVCYGGCNPDNPARPGLTATDIDALIAPRPLLMIEATGDPRPGVAAKQERHREVQRVYEVAGQGEKTRFIIVDGPHGYVPGMYEAAHSWLSRWFGTEADNGPSPESAPAVEPAANLHATTSGEVAMSLGGETVPSLNRAHAAALAARRQPGDRLKEAIRAAIALADPRPDQPARSLDRIDRGAYTLEKIVYYSEPGIFVPAVLLAPRTPGKHAAAVFVNENGKAEPGLVAHCLEPLARAGYAVLSIDPRGMGETDPEAPRDSRPGDYKRLVHDAESNFFHDAIRVGRTVPGMRATDVLAGVGYLAGRPEVDAGRIAVIGHGMGGLLALFAAAFDDRIRAVAATGSLVSYGDIAASELYTHRFGAFGPGFLRTFDLPDVASLIAPRPLLLLNTVDARHRVMEPGAVEDAYRAAAAAFRGAGLAGRFVVAQADSPAGMTRRYEALLAAMPSGGARP